METERHVAPPTSFGSTVVTTVPVGPATLLGDRGVRRRCSRSVPELLVSG